jgi:hypothetical protein
MKNQEIFEQYNTEQWVIEENLCHMIRDYWEKCKEKGYLKDCSHPPINTVGFVKNFMKEESYVEAEYAEKSKMETLENNVIDADFKELPIIEGNYEER